MKLIRLFPFVALLSVLSLTSCNEEIDFAADYKKTAVIYGLLNQADSIHYIKITRAFAGNNNANEVAQIPDSCYFSEVTATITEEINGLVIRTWELDDTLLTNKKPGAFYNPEQKVYYFKATLFPNATYKLDINVNNGEFHVYGETRLVKNLSIVSPLSHESYTFANYNVPDDGYRNTVFKVSPGTAKVLDCRMEIFFNEYIGGVPTEKSFMWKLGEQNGFVAGSNPMFTAVGAVFYQLMQQNCTDNPAIHKREFKRLKVYLTGGSQDLATYLLVNKPSSSLAQNKPSFTNLSATDDVHVIGLFASRYTITLERQDFVNQPPHLRAIDANSTRELCIGPSTGNLSFCSGIPLDQFSSFYCQ